MLKILMDEIIDILKRCSSNHVIRMFQFFLIPSQKQEDAIEKPKDTEPWKVLYNLIYFFSNILNLLD